MAHNTYYRLAKAALSIFYPNQCLVCAHILSQGELCYRCRVLAQQIDLLRRCDRCFSAETELSASGNCYACINSPPIFNKIRFLWRYQNEIKLLIQTMKYRPSRRIAHILGEILARETKNLFQSPNWDLLVPMPSSKQSLQHRLFNQSAILAREISKIARIDAPQIGQTPVSSAALLHTTFKTTPQASLNAKARLKNVARKFVASHTIVNDKMILLIDDVITTGATAHAAAKALLDAGAAGVDLIALSRSDTWNEFRFLVSKL